MATGAYGIVVAVKPNVAGIQSQLDTASKNLSLKISKVSLYGHLQEIRSQIQAKINGGKGYSITIGNATLTPACIKSIRSQLLQAGLQNTGGSTSKTTGNAASVTGTAPVITGSQAGKIPQEQMVAASKISDSYTKYLNWWNNNPIAHNTAGGQQYKAALDGLSAMNTGTSQIASAYNSLINTLSFTQSQLYQDGSTGKYVKPNSIEQLYKQILGYGQTNSKILNSPLGSQYTQLLNELNIAVKNQTPVIPKQMEAWRKGFLDIATAAKSMGLEGQAGLERLGGAFLKFGGWMLVTQSLMMAIRFIKQAVENVKELDTAMTSLKKVTDVSAQSYEDFAKRAAKLSKDAGFGLAGYVKSTADFARLGYSLPESEKLAEAAGIYVNIGEGISIEEATKSLTSTIQAFGIASEDAMSIVDKYTDVGNKFAISSQGIGDALQRSAAAMVTANNSVDESMALVTAANAVIQDPEKVGTALKTMTMYLRAAKTEAEDAGIATDEMAESTSVLREKILALTGNKVDIMLDENTFKSTYQITKEIAAVWNDIDDITQANILNLMGGKRNSNVIAALLNNFDDAERALLVAQNSEGAALKANEIYLDSIQGKSERLHATAEVFSQQILDSDVSKLILDIGRYLLTALGAILKIFSAFDGIVTKTALWSAIVIVIVSSFKKLIALNWAQIGTNIRVWWQGLNKTNIYLMAIVAAIMIISTIAKQSTFEAKLEKLQKSVDNLKSTMDEIASLNDELTTTQEKIYEMSAQSSLTFVENEELNRLKQVNSELESEIINLRAIKQEQQQEALVDFTDVVQKKQSAKYNTRVILDYMHGEVPSKYNTSLNFWEKIWRGIQRGEGLSPGNLARPNDDPTNPLYSELLPPVQRTPEAIERNIADNKAILWDTYEDLFEASKLISDIEWSLFSDEDKQTYREAKDEMWSIAKVMPEKFGGLSEVYKTIYNDKMFEGTRRSLENLQAENNLTEESLDELYEQSKDFQYLLSQLGIEVGKVDWDKNFIDWFEKLNPVIENTSNKFETISAELETMRDAYGTVKGVIEDYNDNGYLSVENYEKLLEVGDEYFNLLLDENGQLNLNAEAYDNLVKAKMREIAVERIRSLFNTILQMNSEEAQAYANAEAYNVEADGIMGLVQAEYALALSRAQLKDRQLGGTTYADATNRALYSAVNIMQMYESATDSLNNTSQKFTETLQNQKEALEDQKQELEDAKDNIQSLIDLVVEMITQENETTKELYEEQKEGISELIEAQKELLDIKKEDAKFTEDLAKKQNAVASDALAASIAELDDSSAGRKNTKLAQDALVDSRSELRTTLTDREYEIRKNALDKMQEDNEAHFDKLIEEIEEYLDNERQLYEDACDLIDNDNGTLYQKLSAYVYNYTTQSESEFNRLWANAQASLQQYDNAHTPLFATMDLLNISIYSCEDAIEAVSEKTQGLSDSVVTGLDNVMGSLERFKELYEQLSGIQYKWSFEYNGKTYKSALSDRELAAWEIQSNIAYDYQGTNFSLPTGAVVAGLRAYASGTTSSMPGLSIVGENGPELRVLGSGDGIIPTSITKNLWALGKSPTRTIAGVISKMINKSSSYITPHNMLANQISCPVHINVQGSADERTIKELKKLAPQIAKQAAQSVMNTALQYSPIARRYQ